MLDVARDNLAQLGIDNVEIRGADLTQLPLDDHSIDAAVANMVLHHAEDPASMLAEMTRVVRPGGWVAITDAVEHPYEWMRTEQADIWLGFTPDRSRASSAPRDWPDAGTGPSNPSETSSPRTRLAVATIGIFAARGQVRP